MRSTVQRARELGLRVVGEGVEDSATIGQLRALGIDLVQGRGVATPMTLAAVTEWLIPGPALVSHAAPARAPRPVLVGENEATIRASTPAWATAGATREPAQPFGPDPMGWILPELGVEEAPAVLTVEATPVLLTVEAAPPERTPDEVPQTPPAALERSFEEMRVTTFAPTFAPPEPPAPRVERDLRIVALESAGRTWELPGAREDKEPERIDERLVLLREYATRQALGSVA